MAGLGFHQLPEDMDVQSLPSHWSDSCWVCSVDRGESEVERGVLITTTFPWGKGNDEGRPTCIHNYTVCIGGTDWCGWITRSWQS